MLKKMSIAVLLLMVLALASIFAYKNYEETYVENSVIDNIYLYDLRIGRNISLRQIINNKPTLIYFTSASCPICVKQRQMFSELSVSQKKSIQWLDVLSNANGVTEWMGRYGGIHDWVTLDADKSLSKTLRLIATPTIILVDRNNRVIYYHRGYLSKNQWNKELYPMVLSSEFDM